MREVPLSAEHGKKFVTLIARASLFRAGFSRMETETNTRIGHLAPADDAPQSLNLTDTRFFADLGETCFTTATPRYSDGPHRTS